MKKINSITGYLTATVLVAGIFTPLSSTASTSLVLTDQGSKWTASTREKYYKEDQGSRVIPLKWINALKQSDGHAFMEDSLSRYGYFPNPKSPEPGLPAGFMAAKEKGEKIMGLTCSACHSRQIDVEGTSYRIDGGPAITDIQSFFTDLDEAVGKVLNDPIAFSEFARGVLGSSYKKTDADKLHDEVAAWYLPYNTIMSRSLPVESPWGPARLDAVSMIFNRLTGLDIGPAPTYMIPENIKLADAPVRYPFVWNAPVQDITQWPGFAPNGNRILGLSRNLGEVIGVFADFHPKKDDSKIYKINYVENNSANFHGLNKQESMIMKLGPPKWPWKLDSKLAAEGEKVFNKKDANEDNKSCTDCHGITKGKKRSLTHETWATPILDVGTDTKEYNLLGSEIKTGVLEGAMLYPGQTPLKAVDKAFSTLGMAVTGSILQHYLPVDLDEKQQKTRNFVDRLAAKVESELDKLEDMGALGNLDDLKETFQFKKSDTAAPINAYESRVLQGVWAAAPYLHNGSVPTLTELLTPANQRVAEFKVGPEYDPEKVGLAVNQSKFNFTLKTTDCSNVNSGNSRCGHDYGTTFSQQEKTALLEYLKGL